MYVPVTGGHNLFKPNAVHVCKETTDLKRNGVLNVNESQKRKASKGTQFACIKDK